MEYFEIEQADEWNMNITERENDDDDKGFLRWSGPNTDMSDVPVGRMHSIFPRAFKAVQESDVSAFMKGGKSQYPNSPDQQCG
jgi:hypothetical protein